MANTVNSPYFSFVRQLESSEAHWGRDRKNWLKKVWKCNAMDSTRIRKIYNDIDVMQTDIVVIKFDIVWGFSFDHKSTDQNGSQGVGQRSRWKSLCQFMVTECEIRKFLVTKLRPRETVVHVKWPKWPTWPTFALDKLNLDTLTKSTYSLL